MAVSEVTLPGMVPQIVGETPLYLVVYKPPKLHTAPLRKGETNTLLSWAASCFPEVLRVRGKKQMEGGLLHRLDYETHGLVLIARTGEAFDILCAGQEAGNIVKDYEALSAGRSISLLGFPPSPYVAPYIPPPPEQSAMAPATAAIIESAFRPWGKGQREVRPIEAAKKGDGQHDRPLYRTEILSRTQTAGRTPVKDTALVSALTERFRLRIIKGFRHQIRCHLAWIGCPIVNDFLYGGSPDCFPAADETIMAQHSLALCAAGLSFTDPHSGKRKEYRIDPLF